MDFKIRYLPLAVEDINNIALYLSQFYSTTASKVIEKLKQQIFSLQAMPLKYEVYKPLPFYRRMVVDDYLVFYHVNTVTQTVDIHRVLRGSWNIKLN